MIFHVITLFPKAFDSYLGESIINRAIKDKKIKVKFYNPRDYVPVGKRSSQKDNKLPTGQVLRGKSSRYIRIDQKPYGGGPGMVIQALPVIKAIEQALKNSKHEIRNSKKSLKPKTSPAKNFQGKFKQARNLKPKIIWLAPSGKQFTNQTAKKYSQKFTDLIIVCGRYEGIDARVKKMISTLIRESKRMTRISLEEISVGPFILTGGELPAMVIIDSVSRQIKGVLGKFDSLEERRVSTAEVYTRPEVIKFKGKKYKVPKILLSGHHNKIEDWKRYR